MDFSFGQNANGVAAAVTNRRFSIHTSLIPCSSPNKAPAGCLQWFTGTSGTGTVQNFNYADGEHLADQVQTICFRYYTTISTTIATSIRSVEVLVVLKLKVRISPVYVSSHRKNNQRKC